MTAGVPDPVPRVTLEDPAAEHQIQLVFVRGGRLVAVSCRCLGRRRHTGARRGFAVREVLPVAQAVAAWRAGHEPGVLP
jgi:hypothetical protein